MPFHTVKTARGRRIIPRPAHSVMFGPKVMTMWRQIALFAAAVGCGSGSKTTTTPQPDVPTSAGSPTRSSSTTSKTDGGATGPVDTGDARVQGSGNRCDTSPVSELTIDGLLDDWRSSRVVARIGSPKDGSVEMRCVWDGQGLALVFDIKDDRVVRTKAGHDDHVTISLSAGGKPVLVDVYPGNAVAKPKITKPAKVSAADSLQQGGFSVEVEIPASAIPEFSASTPALQLEATFIDSDAATGGDETPLRIAQPIELGDRKDLLDDFLATVRLKRTDIKLDQLVDLDPDHAGKERLVYGGTVIGILTDVYGFVSMPAGSAQDVKKVELIPLGPKGSQIISALVRQTGNGGARELLMLWTVWSGQLQPLVTIEVKKELGGNVLESTWKITKGKKGPELVVEPKPAIGFSAENYAEVPAEDADGILLPWDDKRAGIAYSVTGKEITRRDLPLKKKR